MDARIATACAEPVIFEKHGRGVVMVIAVEEYERLNGKPKADRRVWPKR
jgi:hypothetical protein